MVLASVHIVFKVSDAFQNIFPYCMKAVRIVSLSDWPSLVAICLRISRCCLLKTTSTMSFLGSLWPSARVSFFISSSVNCQTSCTLEV